MPHDDVSLKGLVLQKQNLSHTDREIELCADATLADIHKKRRSDSLTVPQRSDSVNGKESDGSSLLPRKKAMIRHHSEKVAAPGRNSHLSEDLRRTVVVII